jgi:hypothetical protein
MNNPLPATLTTFRQNIVLRLVIYYVVLAVTAVAVWQFLPPYLHEQLTEAVDPLVGSIGPPGSFTPQSTSLPPHAVVLMSIIGSISALLLSIPVSWVYMFTRQKKGYQQAVVHTLILLPVVVAMVAALVRNSLALAFGLAGIVAAVRFRTTLEDSKDAVFVFSVIALGLASGVQLEVAAVLSVLFVTITLILWQTDYARTPPSLEGERAERHMQRAIAIANRTSQFVARLDKEILDSMAAPQLDALQARLDKRRSKIEGTTKEREVEDPGPRFDGRLTITVSDPDQAQPVIEGLFETSLKRWKVVRLDRSDGHAQIVYAVRPKKDTTLDAVAESVRRDAAPFVANVETEKWA